MQRWRLSMLVLLTAPACVASAKVANAPGAVTTEDVYNQFDGGLVVQGKRVDLLGDGAFRDKEGKLQGKLKNKYFELGEIRAHNFMTTHEDFPHLPQMDPHAKQQDPHREELLGAEIVWARPPGARHLLVILHDCGGSALDFWRAVWSCPSCDPRPEHLKLTDQSLRSGWAVMTISSQDRTHDKCFTLTQSSVMNLRLNDDLRAVEDVVERWMAREGMQGSQLHVLGLGASTKFASLLPHRLPVVSMAFMLGELLEEAVRTPLPPARVGPPAQRHRRSLQGLGGYPPAPQDESFHRRGSSVSMEQYMKSTARPRRGQASAEDWAKEEAHDVGERAVDVDYMEDEEQPQSNPQTAAVNADGSRMYPPVLFVHMPLDVDTKAKVEASIDLLRSKGVGVGELLLKQRPMTEHYMCNRTFTDTNSKMIPPGVSVNITKMLQYEQKMDNLFFLSEDPTKFDWRAMLRRVVPPTVWTARLERKMADELAVAYGYHAVVGDFTWWMLAWLQGGRIPPLFKEDVLTLQCLGVVYKPLQKMLDAEKTNETQALIRRLDPDGMAQLLKPTRKVRGITKVAGEGKLDALVMPEDKDEHGKMKKGATAIHLLDCAMDDHMCQRKQQMKKSQLDARMHDEVTQERKMQKLATFLREHPHLKSHLPADQLPTYEKHFIDMDDAELEHMKQLRGMELRNYTKWWQAASKIQREGMGERYDKILPQMKFQPPSPPSAPRHSRGGQVDRKAVERGKTEVTGGSVVIRG